MKKLMMAAMMAAAFVATADEWGFTYQAELRDEKGVKPITGSQTVEIRLWETPTDGDTPLWGRSYNILADTNGLFNVVLSDDAGSVVTELTAKDKPKLADVLSSRLAGSVYVGLTVKGSAGEIVPRQRLYAVPFAGTANAARSLVGDTITVGGALKLDGNTSFSTAGITLADSSVSSMGSVSATTVTAKKLTVAGKDAIVETKDIAFSGTLKQKGTEVIPVPVGGIILWNKDTPPEGGEWKDSHWAICDGSKVNGVQTPDLRSRFVVGIDPRDTDYDRLGDNGGVKTVALTTEQMPAHRHKFLSDDGIWDEVGSDKPYAKGVEYRTYDFDFDSKKSKHGCVYANELVGGKGTEGESAAHENRPPYYALYYIMRVM